ncbi:prephenate dehydratase [Neorhodopirellula pilleata]|uniref:prephenate dehydratase n=1 Tax=Neorhodopirellula pilleata TaxID=2714738 RepID=A0A5C6ANA9_9BACT|nr:prephenate dehydratase [Neorhodopirellula pilleata]TWU01533.1 P-protein [Neorhodopirellula pilleata]
MSIFQTIADIDRELLSLLEKRCQLVADELSVTDVSLPEAIRRTEAVIEAEAASRSLSQSTRRAILRHVVSACYQVARPSRVAFLGPVDSYSHLATIAYFGDCVEYSPVASIKAVFEAVAAGQENENGGCEFGVVPIENSTDGRVVDTLGRLAIGEVNLTGEVLMSIHHNLLSIGKLDEIIEVHSKPQALSQCRRWLADHLPEATLVETASTTAAAAAAAASPTIAAIASLPAATRYGLGVLEASIEDNRDNVTRFAVLGSQKPAPTGNDKTTLLFQVEHRPGALADVMGIFKQAQLNLTWIESFPQPGRPNEYFFVVEFPGHRDAANVSGAIETLVKETRQVRVLGSYPCGRRI